MNDSSICTHCVKQVPENKNETVHLAPRESRDCSGLRMSSFDANLLVIADPVVHAPLNT